MIGADIIEVRRKKAEQARKWYAANPPTEEQKRAKKERNRLWLLANPERKRENARAWKRANPDKVAANQKRYAEAHPEKIKEKWQRHQANHPEKSAARQRLYRKRHPEKRDEKLEKQRAYYATEEGKNLRRLGEKRRRLARQASTGVIATRSQIAEFRKSATACAYCCAPFGADRKATIDHCIPLSRGGPHTMENIVAACWPCNLAKFKKTRDEFSPSTTGASLAAIAFGTFT